MMFHDLLMNLFRNSPPQTSNGTSFVLPMTKTLPETPRDVHIFSGFFGICSQHPALGHPHDLMVQKYCVHPVDGRENPPCNLQRFKKHLKWLFGISCMEHR